jgi:hypothetical protein
MADIMVMLLGADYCEITSLTGSSLLTGNERALEPQQQERRHR